MSHQEVAGPYAAVIIATPLEGSHIRCKGVGVRPPPAREYQRVTTTYVTGHLQADYFGVQRLPTGWSSSTTMRRLCINLSCVLIQMCAGKVW